MLFDMDISKILGREEFLFREEVEKYGELIRDIVRRSSFLVLGGAGSVGQQVVKELIKYTPPKLHIVDLNENNLVELVRDVRSSDLESSVEFKTFVLDISSREFEEYFRNETPFDYIMNLSALKHVRSEKDPYTLMRMVQVNVINVNLLMELAVDKGCKRFFSVSTDKAVNPVNLMGATKRIMELLLKSKMDAIGVSSSRFVNVAFSEGSLLWGFLKRLEKDQPLAAPEGISRYFITPEEAGALCAIAALLSKSGDIFIPKMQETLEPLCMVDIACRLLNYAGFEPYLTHDGAEAKRKLQFLKSQGKWPVYITPADTTGEKELEELYYPAEIPDFNKFNNIGVVNLGKVGPERYDVARFIDGIKILLDRGGWSREEISRLAKRVIPEFVHRDTGTFLDDRM
ncbi:MAG: polysaccharide biosynthesis protein [Candidatus Hydrothermia bacterium]